LVTINFQSYIPYSVTLCIIIFLFLQLPDGDASVAFDLIAAASSSHTNRLAEIPVDPFKISIADGKNIWPGDDIRHLTVLPSRMWGREESYVTSKFTIYILFSNIGIAVKL
jgi:hypothetical protein